MRILLDECLPKRLKREFGAGHLVLTVPEAGWAGLKNGILLTRAEGQFDVFVTTDTSLEYQENLGSGRLIALVAAANNYFLPAWMIGFGVWLIVASRRVEA